MDPAFPIRMFGAYLRMIIVLMVMPLALVACQTAQATYPAGATPQTSVDVKVAEASAKLAKYCVLLKAGLLTASAFVTDAKVQQAINVANPAVSRFCDAPPQNVADATVQVAQLVNELNIALSKAVPPPVPTGV